MAVAEERTDGIEARVGQRLEERAVAAGLGRHPPSVPPDEESPFAAPPPPTPSTCSTVATASVPALATSPPAGRPAALGTARPSVLGVLGTCRPEPGLPDVSPSSLPWSPLPPEPPLPPRPIWRVRVPTASPSPWSELFLGAAPGALGSGPSGLSSTAPSLDAVAPRPFVGAAPALRGGTARVPVAAAAALSGVATWLAVPALLECL